MAEVIVSLLVEVLSNKLVSFDFSKLVRSQGIKPLLNKWKKDLQVIQAVLADAAQKQISQKPVEVWLQELQNLAYDIEDFVDDLTTNVMHRSFHQQSLASTSTSQIWNIFPSCCTNFIYDIGLSSKQATITRKLKNLVDQKNNLGLDVNVKVERSDIPIEQTSLVDETKVMGREADKEALLKTLLGNEACDQNVSVVSIVGLGGIGKTTLAKVLYNDENVKNHFALRAWVCVTNEFDVFNISKAIFQAVSGEENQAYSTLNCLHEALQKKLENNRFLVVLDNVWNENHEKWETLRTLFSVGARGSKIIITTQNTKVATLMNSVQPYNLEVLSDEASLCLFAKYTLDEENFDNHPSLGSIARSIIRKCRGLPLSLVTLARVLKTKGTSSVEWKMIMDCEIWSLQDVSILPALKLSYYDLPSHLKPLFAYCSLFPKNYEFDKNELVLLWMAEGFLPRLEVNQSMENVGRQYFKELHSRSFFQHSTTNKSRYTMHDWMNELAKSVAKDFFLLDDEMDHVIGRNDAFEKFRHFSFVGQRQRQHAVYKRFKDVDRASRLRTFLPVSISWQEFNPLDTDLVQLLPRLKFLRVLSLTNHSITEVPQSIDSLKHLRYLNFSRTSIKELPNQVSNLYNLQSLLVRDCDKLSSLPASFDKLTNLRHFDITGTLSLKKTPLGIGGLKSLQTLPKVYIVGGNGFKVCELKDLSNLQGRLSIKGLDKVMNPIQATDANLLQKEGLDDLDMEWNEHLLDDSRNSKIEYEVFEALRPHSKLKKLNILFYGGIKFPTWVGDPSFNLTELTLEGCRSCTHLPTVEHLGSLKKFAMRSLHMVKSLSFEGILLFPSLEVLEIYDMQGLEILSTRDGNEHDETARSFRCLRRVYIKHCPKLAVVSISLIPSLEVLRVEECSEAVLSGIVCASPSILRLTMCDIRGLTQLHGEVLNHLRAVEHLCIKNCHELRYLWESESEACKFLVKLKKLELYNCNMLVALGQKEFVLESKNINSFPPHDLLKGLTSLEQLGISDCPRLRYSIPFGLWPLQFRNL